MAEKAIAEVGVNGGRGSFRSFGGGPYEPTNRPPCTATSPS